MDTGFLEVTQAIPVWLIPALIAAGGSLVSSIPAIFQSRRGKEMQEKGEAKQEKAIQSLEKVLAQRQGYWNALGSMIYGEDALGGMFGGQNYGFGSSRNTPNMVQTTDEGPRPSRSSYSYGGASKPKSSGVTRKPAYESDDDEKPKTRTRHNM